MTGHSAPLVITFASGSTLQREPDRASDLRIVRNGPPGTFVRLADVRISLPTDQIVEIDEHDGTVTAAFGGMRFTGVQDTRLTFTRVRDLRPEEELSPDRSWTMTLEPQWVAAVYEDGEQVWPASVPRRAGLCASCAQARAVTSARRSVFTLCQRSSTELDFARYPALPVLRCRGHQPR